jgi:hypothetical protein
MPHRRRPVALLPLLLLATVACDPAGLGVAAAVGAGSVVVIGRTPVDAVVSAVSGRDCSVVRLDRGLGYCRPEEPPPPPQPYCTRSLGGVDCWRQPPLALPTARGLADGPATLTEAQEAHRTRRWPGPW